MILLIDNDDSFVHTLARYVEELGAAPVVRRHTDLRLADVEALGPSHIILSPGPCTPTEATTAVAVVRRFGTATPILGVCLGHQCIGQAYGGRVVSAGRPRHGKTSPIAHDGAGIFDGLPNPFPAARYHSLVLDRATLPSELEVCATSADDGEIMAVRHRTHPVVGVQFHPESVLSSHGYRLLWRFLGAAAGPGVEPAATADGAGG